MFRPACVKKVEAILSVILLLPPDPLFLQFEHLPTALSPLYFVCSMSFPVESFDNKSKGEEISIVSRQVTAKPWFLQIGSVCPKKYPKFLIFRPFLSIFRCVPSNTRRSDESIRLISWSWPPRSA